MAAEPPSRLCLRCFGRRSSDLDIQLRKAGMSGKKLLLDFGSGGKASHRLISGLFLKHFDNPVLGQMDDAASFELSGTVAMSTDSYTVDPIFFPGGDIGSLAVHGTVNDVAMLGARPLYLSCAFILEEGMDMDDLERIVESMAKAAREAGVIIVTGDTKVVPRGAVDKIFINTTGIGQGPGRPRAEGQPCGPGGCRPGQRLDGRPRADHPVAQGRALLRGPRAERLGKPEPSRAEAHRRWSGMSTSCATPRVGGWRPP
jgi:hypothetical protein